MMDQQVNERTALLSSQGNDESTNQSINQSNSTYQSSATVVIPIHASNARTINQSIDQTKLDVLYQTIHQLSSDRLTGGAYQSNNRSHATSSEPLIGALHLPWFHSVNEVADALGVDSTIGLSVDQVLDRRSIVGLNSLPTIHPSILQTVKEEITEPLILMLLSVAVLYFLWGSISQAITIAALVCLCISIEIGVEHHANQTINSLAANKVPSTVTVLRCSASGQSTIQSIDPTELVPGDIIELNAGDAVPADVRLVDCMFVLVDESSLTGESDWVDKTTDRSPNTPASQPVNQFDHSCMLWSGTFLTQGRARGIVVTTGTLSTAGTINQSISQSRKRRKTPLQQALKKLAYQLTILTVVIVLVCFLVCMITFMSTSQSNIQPFDLFSDNISPHQPTGPPNNRWTWSTMKQAMQQSILVCLSLAFAVIPEELPILIKVIAGYQSINLSKHQLIVRSLRSIEGLANINVLLTDKTGTITMQRLLVERVALFDGKSTTNADVRSSLPQALLTAWARSNPSLQMQIRPIYTVDQHRAVPSRELKEQHSDVAVPLVDCSSVNDRFDPAVLRALSIDQSVDNPSVFQLSPEHYQLLTKSVTIESFLPFDTRRRSSTIVSFNNSHVIYSRGSIDAILAVCSHVRFPSSKLCALDPPMVQRLLNECSAVARSNNGVRILAFASRSVDQSKIDHTSHLLKELSDPFLNSAHGHSIGSKIHRLECDMVFEGLIGFTDELRHGVNESINESISQLKQAGITIKMVTGDSVDTAAAIAQTVGLLDPLSGHQSGQITELKPPTLDESLSVTSNNQLSLDQIDKVRVFCRQSPLDKLNLVRAHQHINRSMSFSSNSLADYSVMVTGDGLNDAPSLACAEVGLSMGSNYVARQAAGIVLLEHSINRPSNQPFTQSFESIVLLVREGRSMMNNLVTAIQFYLACKATLICLFIISLVFAGYIPMQPVHVILLECFMDLGASVAFTTEKPEKNIMIKPPSKWRTSTLISGRWFWIPIGVSASVLYVAVGGVFWMAHLLIDPFAYESVEQKQNIVQTMTFVSWMIGHVLLAHVVRTWDHSMFIDSILELLHRRTSSVQGSNDRSTYMTLTSNKMMFVWTLASFLCVGMCLSIAALRELLQLQDLWLSYVGSHVPALFISVMWPVVLFCAVELVKYVYSLTYRI